MNSVISLLNAQFPQLPRWRQVLLAIAAILASIECVSLTLDGEKFAQSLVPLFLVLLVWMSPPTKPRDRFGWWLFIACLAIAIGWTDFYIIEHLMN
jgi:hypothetical protein